eukprot:TRINITY_DN2630_c0_g1_i3.p1 TRINITY_DN2630_c0_g1~~TRINITY_DN2630_c0_g1_i3.p1  ORF type:complete len:573 (-),score=133.99 TRINITY_DN2630_c0_g1_i3:323-2041(-)
MIEVRGYIESDPLQEVRRLGTLAASRARVDEIKSAVVLAFGDKLHRAGGLSSAREICLRHPTPTGILEVSSDEQLQALAVSAPAQQLTLAIATRSSGVPDLGAITTPPTTPITPTSLSPAIPASAPPPAVAAAAANVPPLAFSSPLAMQQLPVVQLQPPPVPSPRAATGADQLCTLLASGSSLQQLRKFIASALGSQQAGTEVATLLDQFDKLNMSNSAFTTPAAAAAKSPSPQPTDPVQQVSGLVQQLMNIPDIAQLLPSLLSYLWSLQQAAQQPAAITTSSGITIATLPQQLSKKWGLDDDAGDDDDEDTDDEGGSDLGKAARRSRKKRELGLTDDAPRCASCEDPLRGVYFQCTVCNLFFLCTDCESGMAGSEHDPSHPFLKVRKGLPAAKHHPYAVPGRRFHGAAHDDTARQRHFEEMYGRAEQAQRPLMAHFVEDVTLNTGGTVETCSSLVKIWRLRNDSKFAWPQGSRVHFLSGDRMESAFRMPVMSCLPARQLDIAIDVLVGPEERRYVGYWQLHGPDGTEFGDVLKIDVIAAKVRHPQGVTPVVECALVLLSVIYLCIVSPFFS